jgi:NAD(P)-dependent dehydrogenase (short-subunit alcohol dehydrogenase family)
MAPNVWASQESRRVAIVTGGAGAIGLGVAVRLAEEGVAVTVADLSKPDLKNDVSVELDASLLDVSAEDQVNQLFADVVRRHGRLDFLVHCAAIFPGRRFEDLDAETWSRTLATNLTGSFLCSRAALRYMVAQQSGSVVLLSSMLARTGGADCAHYAASKGGVLGLARSMALDVATRGVRVNTVSPGITDTPQPRGHMSEAEMYQHAKDIPMGRIGHVRDVVNAVIFLLSDESSFLTGQDIRVNGGYPLW